MVNKKALEAYSNRFNKKSSIPVKSIVVKPTVKKSLPNKDEQIAALEAQLAALKSLTVSTSSEKVS